MTEHVYNSVMLFDLCFFRLVQVEEKTVAHTTTTSGTRQEQRTVTQEVISTSTILAPESKTEVKFY